MTVEVEFIVTDKVQAISLNQMTEVAATDAVTKLLAQVKVTTSIFVSLKA
jgi:hypothetical protein